MEQRRIRELAKEYMYPPREQHRETPDESDPVTPEKRGALVPEVMDIDQEPETEFFLLKR